MKTLVSIAVMAAFAANSHWTCPMHPQIHSDGPGECPICHMKLVQVTARDEEAAVSAPQGKWEALGIQKIAVKRMNLTARIPLLGRLISPSVVAFQVYESDVRHVKPGQAFRGVSGMNPELEISGKIAAMDGIADPVSRTIRIVGRIEKGAKGLIPETTVSGEIEIEIRDAIAVPESSVLHSGKGDLVYVIRDRGFVAVPVKLGRKAGNYYEVLSGLSPGQFISSGPNFLIDSEAKILDAGGETSGHAHN
jgi:multidrug efflux pump subunit AcrA (membrane-fusion protein)